MAALVIPKTWTDLVDALNASNLNAGVRDAIQQLIPLRGLRSADVTTNTAASLTPDTQLNISVATNTDYLVSGVILYTAAGGSGTAQLKCSWTAPAGATFWGTMTGLALDGTSATKGSFTASSVSLATGYFFGAAGTGTPVALLVNGYLRISGTAGDFQYNYAQANTDAVNLTTIKTGSHVVLQQVA